MPEDLKTILSHPEKKEIFEKMLIEKIKTEVKNLLEALALAEREIFCKKQGMQEMAYKPRKDKNNADFRICNVQKDNKETENQKQKILKIYTHNS